MKKIAKEYKIGPNGFSILALSSLLLKAASTERDDRNSVIEVQFDRDVGLKSPELKGIVLADEWLNDPELEQALKDIGCIIETYPLYPLSRSSYYSKIYECCEKIEDV